jgi:hypothetical protein
MSYHYGRRPIVSGEAGGALAERFGAVVSAGDLGQLGG